MVASPKVNWSEWSRFVTAEKLPPANGYSTEVPRDAETLVEWCGRLCYMSFGKGRKTNAAFIDNIIKSQHFSVLEHANWTFIITGVSRSLTHELVRHRHFSYSQLSQRYVDQSDGDAMMPNLVSLVPELQDEWLLHQARSRTLYKKIVDRMEAAVETADCTPTNARKAIRGVARSVLTEATETKIAVTGNARAWREFIQKRNSPAADTEIRCLAKTLLEALWQDAPEIFRDLHSQGVS
jgi:thymidylate synthase (FAD)